MHYNKITSNSGGSRNVHNMGGVLTNEEGPALFDHDSIIPYTINPFFPKNGGGTSPNLPLTN